MVLFFNRIVVIAVLMHQAVQALNEKPKFDVYQFLIRTTENATIGSSIGRILVNDSDGDPIVLSLDSTSSKIFNIDNTGNLTLKKELDREDEDEYSVMVTAADLCPSCKIEERKISKEFIVIIEDVNDNNPEFVDTPYIARVAENDTVDHLVIKVTACDKDTGKNALVNYMFSSSTQGSSNPWKTDTFKIDNHNGEIRLAGGLDFETFPRYTLFVIAKDSGRPPLESQTTVIVYVKDVSDTPPVFLKPTYLTDIPENQVKGSVLLQVQAFDGDLDVNNPIEYEIAQGNDEGLFVMDAMSGNMTLNGTIDAEDTDFYRIIVKASEIPDRSSHTTAVVVISVEDQNDNSPQFPQDSYQFRVREDLAMSGYVITDQFNVRDADIYPENRRFEYSLSGEDGKFFAISSSSGILTVNATLDYEKRSNFSFKVFANETETKEGRSGFASVTVELINVNDNKPIFNKTSFNFTFHEEVPVGFVIATVTATDEDRGSYGEVKYILYGPGAMSFEVGIANGTISASRVLDYEQNAEYEFFVLAYDEGRFMAEDKDNVASFRVSLVDINDNNPMFEGTPYNVEIMENQTNVVFVLQVTASDKDSGENGKVSFNITDGNIDSVFAINSSGAIVTTTKLDRETKSSYSLTVMAYDHGVPSRNATTVVVVTVLDKNDNPPEIEGGALITINVSERTGGGSIVYTVRASDKDDGSNKKLTYAISAGDHGRFILNSNTGVLQVSPTGLDREVQSNFNLTINVTDGGNPTLWKSTLVHVVILDINDNAPEFEPNPSDASAAYIIAINEGPDSANKVVIDLNATDQDYGTNADLQYSMTGDQHDQFEVDSSTGDLRVRTVLDRENVNMTLDAQGRGFFSLDIKGTDQAEPQYTRRSAVVRVTIIVNDINDNAPQFIDPPQSTSISEAARPGSNVIQVSAFDKDLGFAGKVVYNITAGDPSGNFEITPNGYILVKRPLDAEKEAVFNLTVEATDEGEPRRRNSTTVYLTVDDVNDNDPKFKQSSYVVSLMENSNRTSSVVTVHATDDDQGENGLVSYRISNGNRGNAFQIDNNTGFVTVNGPIDREKIEEYSLTVQAEDAGHPSSRKAFADVVIRVLDENDNSPQFMEKSYEAEISENSPAGMTVLPKISIRATDKDEGTNARISFTLAGPGSGIFDINSTTAVITTRSNYTLDREANDTYHLAVIATDGGNESSSVPLVVKITDVNDEFPRFSRQVYHASVPEDAARGTTVRRVTATDLDSFILYKEIAYTSTGADAKFYISRTTGDIIVDSNLDREFKSQYVLYVTAANIGENAPEGHCVVNITVTDVIDEKPYFASELLTFHVSEDALVGMNVTQLRAKDEDVGDNITYFMDSEAMFRINQSTGLITTAGRLDRENKTEHVLYVRAVDSVNLTSGRVKLVVKVDDVNDHAPKFTRPIYIEDYREQSPEGTSVLTVSANDADVGANSEIRFRIVENVTRYVTIDPVSGLVTQAQVELDRELAADFNFTVRATDLGSPPLSSDVSVSLQLVDINDNSPTFNQTSYQAHVMENQPIGTQVLVVTATDEDVGTNAMLSYGLSSDTFRFQIDHDTGNITTLAPLDREQVGSSSYTLTIVAVDGAIRNRHGTAQVIVTVLDDNEHPPVFSQANYVFQVSERENTGHLVGKVAATDDDKGVNAEISFFLYSGNKILPFEVNETTGDIKTTQDLDRERNSSFTFVVTARDHGNPHKESNVTARVVINDVNDNTPTFQRSSYNASLLESTFLQTEIVTVSATDPDEGANGQFTYSIVDGDSENHFSIDANSGAVTLLKILDHETKAFYNITIRARDLGSTPQYADTTLLITVIDVDDNPPIFHQNRYTAALLENATAGAFVSQVNATDADADAAHKRVHYRIEHGNELKVFVIGELNGTVYLNWTGAHLDRENVASYTLTIAAVSRVNDTELKSTVPMIITVLDVNDFTPMFVPQSYVKQVVEDTRKLEDVDDKTILTVSAKDDDIGENAHVAYKVISGNEEGSFVLNNKTGVLFKTRELDRERTELYSLRVAATDQGESPLSSETTINITVLDANDNIPQIHTQSLFAIPENATVGTLITRINATDKDLGTNADITFSIISGNDEGAFKLNGTSGELVTFGNLDYDKEPFLYKLTIKAKDNGRPALSSEKTITIALENINDNKPTFIERRLALTVDENLPAGAVVGTISASDADQTGPIFYYIKDGNANAVFSLNKTTGVLRTSRVIDRENSSQFNLYIKASNEKLDPNSLVLRNKRTIPNDANTTEAPLPEDRGVLLVIVRIGDENDNGPRFTKALYTGGVSEDAKHGSNILQVLALDADEGNNSRISYGILQSKDASEFSIDRETGWIKAKASFAGRLESEFIIGVIAKDRFGEEPYFNDTAEVKIYVLTDVQRAVIVSGRSPEFIREHQDSLKRVLENITGYIINIDDINYYKDEEGNYDYDRTAVLFHAIDPKTKRVVDKDTVIKKVDENYPQHLKFFEEWKIKEVKAHVPPKAAEEFPIVLVVAIGLSILLTLIVFVFCGVVVQLRKRQKRKLRAAAATSYGGSRSVNETLSSIPTTNLHISERSNPMWVDPYHNWGLKTEADDGAAAATEPSPFYGTFHPTSDATELYDAQTFSRDPFDDEDDADREEQSETASRRSSNPPSTVVYKSSPISERRYFTNSEKYEVTSI